MNEQTKMTKIWKVWEEGENNSKYSTLIGCLRTRVRKQPIIALYLVLEWTQVYNLESWWPEMENKGRE